MILLTKNFTIEQNRNCRPVYRNLNDPDYHINYGKPVKIKCSDFISLKISEIELSYDKTDKEVIKRLLNCLQEIQQHSR